MLNCKKTPYVHLNLTNFILGYNMNTPFQGSVVKVKINYIYLCDNPLKNRSNRFPHHFLHCLIGCCFLCRNSVELTATVPQLGHQVRHTDFSAHLAFVLSPSFQWFGCLLHLSWSIWDERGNNSNLHEAHKGKQRSLKTLLPREILSEILNRSVHDEVWACWV